MREVIKIIDNVSKVHQSTLKANWIQSLYWVRAEQILLHLRILLLYNHNMNSSLVINIQILQLFSCLKWTRQQILSTLRRQRSLATVLPIGTERVSAWVCLRIIMGCRERERKRERGCLWPLIMQHHSLCIDPLGEVVCTRSGSKSSLI